MFNMLFFILVQFIAFPNKNDALLKEGVNSKSLIIESSGSLGLHYGGKCHQTFPNETVYENQKLDWCSNIVPKESNVGPWVMYSFKNKEIKLTSYSVRNGCCWYPCCCIDDDRYIDGYCCCRLYSYSLQGSNDNSTWITIHKIEKDSKFYDCQFKTYEFPETQPFKYIRFILDEEYPGCPKCMQLNQVELYGKTTDSIFSSYENDDNDESVSIIGKVKSYNN